MEPIPVTVLNIPFLVAALLFVFYSSRCTAPLPAMFPAMGSIPPTHPTVLEPLLSSVYDLLRCTTTAKRVRLRG